MSAFWSSLILQTEAAINNIDMQLFEMQQDLETIQNRIQQAQEDNVSIWNNKEAYAYGKLSYFNNSMMQEISRIQGNQNLTPEQKNTEIQAIYARMQNAKLNTETYMKQYQQMQTEASRMMLQPLQRKETMAKMRKTHLENTKKNKEERLETYIKNNEKADQSIFGSKAQS